MTARAQAGQIEVHETHSGVVILAGDYAYKSKKAVDLTFLDFTTEAARRAACLHEIELNRRLAPDVYGDLATFTRPDADVHEPVIVMRRMPEQLRLSTLVTAGADVDDHLRSVARLLARFHARAQRSVQIDQEGSAVRLRGRWAANLRESRQFRPSVLDPTVHARIGRLALRYVDGRRALLDSRIAAGLIVDGHGDLIAEDIFCLSDYPRVLDCIEFDDRLRWVDVLDDAAFLAMDLERLGRPDLAMRFLGWYEQFSAVPTVASLAHHYIAYRAFVRAKVSAVRAQQGKAAAAAAAAQHAQLAMEHLQSGEVRLILVGGAPGTGKSTVASALAEQRGYALLSTDAIRREINMGEDRYGQAAKDAVYAELLARARHALEFGTSVVADATWGDDAWRRAAAAVAHETVSRLVCLECVAPVEVAAARAQRRAAAGRDLSEADATVARALAADRSPWPDATPVDTSGPVERALAAALPATGPG